MIHKSEEVLLQQIKELTIDKEKLVVQNSVLQNMIETHAQAADQHPVSTQTMLVACCGDWPLA